MKNLLGRRVKLDGDNDYNYTGEGRIVGYNKNGVMIEINSLTGWVEIADDETYINNYEIPEGCSLMWVGGYAYELIKDDTIDTLEEGDHFWGKLDNKIAVFILGKWGYVYTCGEEDSFPLHEIEFISKIDIPQDYSKKDLYY